MITRRENEGDADPIHDVTAAAFQGKPYSSGTEAHIVEALRAAGDTAWSMWARVAMAWLGFVPAAYVAVFVRGGGHVAAMLCILGYMAALGLALVYRFRSGAWRRIDLVGEPTVV